MWKRTSQVAGPRHSSQRGVAAPAGRGDIPVAPTVTIMPRTSPPLPRCAFRVAIAGHRPDRFPAQAIPAIEEDLRRALQVIRDEVIRVAGDPANGYAQEQPVLTML